MLTDYTDRVVCSHTDLGAGNMRTTNTAASDSAISTPAPHTPGPWEASAEGVWAKSPWNARVRIASVTHFSQMNGISTEANARLIAAAPDMLNALKAVADFYGWTGSSLGATARQAVNAIAKAEGK